MAGPAQRQAATAAVQAVQKAARDKVPPPRFETVIADSIAKLQTVFGLPVSAGG